MSQREAEVAVALQKLVADVLGPPTGADAVHLDVDVLSAPEQLVDDRPLDSLDLISLFTAIEDTFDIALAELPDALDALTLSDLARMIVDGSDAG